MNRAGNPLTILDFELAITKLRKYAQEVFAGTNEEKKIQVLDGIQKLIDPSATPSIKTPTEVIYRNPVSEINNQTDADTDDDASTDVDSDDNTDDDDDTNTDTNSDTNSDTKSDAGTDSDSDTDSETEDIISEAKYPKHPVPKLPNELLMKVMSYLKNKDIFGNFALVNKHFHDLTLDPSTVKYLHLKDTNDTVKSKEVYRKWKEVIKRSKTLIELRITTGYKPNWDELIVEALKTHQNLKSLRIEFTMYGCFNNYRDASVLPPAFTEALKFAKGLQNFESKGVHLDSDFLNEICNLQSLRRFSVTRPQRSAGWIIITPEFVKNLAFSKNPIEEFDVDIASLVIRNYKKPFLSAVETLYTEKKNTLKTLMGNFTHELRRENDHKHCDPFPNFNMCKNITSIHAHLHKHDLALISDLPKLEILSLKNEIKNANYLKSFHQINFSNLKYLFIEVKTKTKCDDIFNELSNVSFPSLKRLFVANNFHDDKGVSITEKTLENLIKNVPSLKSLILECLVDFVSEISRQFMFNMMMDEDVVIIVDSYVDYPDKSEIYEKSVKKFLKGKGPIFYKKYKSMRNEYLDQRWMRFGTKETD